MRVDKFFGNAPRMAAAAQVFTFRRDHDDVPCVGYKDSHLLHPSLADYEHYRSFKWWLIPHGITGALALFLGPLQFSKRLRQRHLNWHRLAGRAYVYGVAVAAPLGVYMEYLKYAHGIGSLRLVIATVGFATLFLCTTGMGFLRIRQRKIQKHREWMTRSFAVALIFLETRCIDQIPWLGALFEGPSNLFESHQISDLWILIICAPIAAEIVLRCEDLLTRRPVVGAR
jgi:hypothetical protein